jgi:hypothetical protein
MLQTTQKEVIIDNLNWHLPLDEAKEVFDFYCNLNQTEEQKEKLLTNLSLKEDDLKIILFEKAESLKFDIGSIMSIHAILDWLYQGKIDFIMDLKPNKNNEDKPHGKFLNWLFEELGL